MIGNSEIEILRVLALSRKLGIARISTNFKPTARMRAYAIRTRRDLHRGDLWHLYLS